MPTALTAVLASGVFAATLPTGHFLLRAVGTDSMRSTFFWLLAVPVGVAAWSPVLLLAAYAGWFRPEVLGSIGWLVTIAGLVYVRHRIPGRPRSIGAAAGMALAALVPLGWLYAAFPNESLLGTRDEGIYSLMAMLLVRTGGVVLTAPAELAPALFAPFVNGQAFFLPGVYATADGVQLQFAPLFPAWVAQFTVATGGWGAFRTSAFLALASTAVFFALARQMFRPALAVLATVVFALEPAQVWAARNNLAEVFAQLLVLGGLLAAVCAVRARARELASLAGLLFGLASFCRLDLLILAPLIIVYVAAVTLWSEKDQGEESRVLIGLAIATVFTQAMAVAVLAWMHPIYLADNLAPVGWAAGVSGAGVLALIAARFGLRRMTAVPVSRIVLASLSAATLVALFAYAVWVRPELEPFAKVMRPGSPLDGMRDHRESSLVNLAAYLGWPALVLALLGSIATTTRFLRGRLAIGPGLVLLGAIVAAGAVLSNPRISPDHFWGIRRFVPLAIPGVILLATFGLRAVLLPLVRNHQRWVVGSLACVAAASLLSLQWPLLLFQENRGVPSALDALDAHLGNASLVLVRDLDPVATSLFVGYGRPVLPLRDGASPVDSRTRAFWERCAVTMPCVLLHTDFSGLGGLALGATRRMLVAREFIASTVTPLPRTTARESTWILATPVLGLDREQISSLSGGYRNWHFDDRGFYREEIGQGWSSRWTDGHATLRLPALRADTLEVILGTGATGAGDARIVIDDSVVFTGALPPGLRRLSLRLPAALPANGRTLEIASSTFVPKLQQPGSSLDDRKLGLAILAVRQLDSQAPRLMAGASNDAYRAQVDIVGAPFTPPLMAQSTGPPLRIALAIRNVGELVWPARGDVQAGEAPVAVGVLWLRNGSDVPVLEQRVDLPFSLHPGERLLLAPQLLPRLENGTALPPGPYEVAVGLVQEGITWFAAQRGAMARLPVTIGATEPGR
jgi:hypothetical protein